MTRRILIVLDSPNCTSLVSLAGLPATILTRAAALQRAGVEVVMLVGDRGMDPAAASRWPFEGFLVNPSLLYGAPEILSPTIEGLYPELIITNDAEFTVRSGRLWADRCGAHLVYEAHDDEGRLAESLGDTHLTEVRAEWQRLACMTADHVIVLTEREAEVMRRHGVSDENLLVAPLAVDCSQRTNWGPNHEARRLLFLGNLNYPPNQMAVARIRSLIDELRASGVDAVARIVGRGPEHVTRAADGIEFTGPVDDLDLSMSEVTLALAPIEAGSGPKCKVLEYLAAGLPVLATQEAVNGLDSGYPGIVLADRLESWAEIVMQLFSDAGALQRLGVAARSHAESRALEKLAELVKERFHSWLASPGLGRRLGLFTSSQPPQWQTDHGDALGSPALTLESLLVALPMVL